jgi:hypothetical protein
VPDVFGPPAAPGAFGAEAAGGTVPGASFALGFGAPRAGPAAGGTGGAPFVPGTGRALAFGNASGDMFVGNGLLGAGV